MDKKTKKQPGVKEWAIILAAGFTAVYGRIYDRKGFTRAVAPALGLLMAWYKLHA